ncbi:hypothetical protein GCM10020295_35480 [Streptomyces cinereospinus]
MKRSVRAGGGGRRFGEPGQLRRPAGAARTVVRRLFEDQGGDEAFVHVVEFAADDPYDVGRLPAPPPGPGDVLQPAPGEFRVRRRVGREEGRAGVEGGVVVVGGVEGGLEGAVDGAGVHGGESCHAPLRALSTQS